MGRVARRTMWAAGLVGTLMLGTSAYAGAGDPRQADPYPLDTCIVSGQKLGAMGTPVVVQHEGREIKLCCGDCEKKFKEDPKPYVEKLDEAIVKQQLPYYPLETCVVTGESLKSMGGGIDHVHGNNLVRLCCSGCVKKVEDDPGRYMAALDSAVVEKQKASYLLEVCPVTGHKLGEMGAPVDFVIANRLVRLCCAECAGKVAADPARYLAKIGPVPSTATQPAASGQGEAHGAHQHGGGHHH